MWINFKIGGSVALALMFFFAFDAVADTISMTRAIGDRPARIASLKRGYNGVVLLGCQPEYPLRARHNDEQGVVSMRFTLDAESKLIDISVLKSSGSRALDKAAVEGFSKCQFESAIVNGVAVPSTIEWEFVFTLY